MSCDRAHGGGGRRIAICLGTNVNAVAVPLDQAGRYRRNNLSTGNSRSVVAGMLLVLSFSGASSSRFGRRGGGDAAAYVDHVPRNVHIPMRPCIPHGFRGRGRRGLQGIRVSYDTGLLLGCHS